MNIQKLMTWIVWGDSQGDWLDPLYKNSSSLNEKEDKK